MRQVIDIKAGQNPCNDDAIGKGYIVAVVGRHMPHHRRGPFLTPAIDLPPEKIGDMGLAALTDRLSTGFPHHPPQVHRTMDEAATSRPGNGHQPL